LDAIHSDEKKVQEELQNLQYEIEEESKRIDDARVEIAGLQAQIDSLEQLSDESFSSQELQDMSGKAYKLKQIAKTVFKEKNELEKKKAKINYQLVNVLYKGLQDLKART
jgi:chromosome segregation ATPase